MSCLSFFNRRGFIFINNFFTKQETELIVQSNIDNKIINKINRQLIYFNSPQIITSLTKQDIYLYDNLLTGDDYFGDWQFKKSDLLIHKYDINKEDLINFNFIRYRNNYIRV